jgi:ferredoxin-NADP reductase
MNDIPALGARLEWQEARVVRIVPQTPTVKSFYLRPPAWAPFMAGQHIDVRLTAPDGYQAERSYSIGSAPDSEDIELVIERLASGEVSPFFHEAVIVGDTIELRGPIGGHFIWRVEDGGPLLLVGGGSGVVPLMSILRHRANRAATVPTALIYSVRQSNDIIFRQELIERAESDTGFHLFGRVTRGTPDSASFGAGRIDAALVGQVLASLGGVPKRTYICGSNAFVDTASRLLLDMDVPFASIRTERYGGAPAAVTGEPVVPGA